MTTSDVIVLIYCSCIYMHMSFESWLVVVRLLIFRDQPFHPVYPLQQLWILFLVFFVKIFDLLLVLLLLDWPEVLVLRVGYFFHQHVVLNKNTGTSTFFKYDVRSSIWTISLLASRLLSEPLAWSSFCLDSCSYLVCSSIFRLSISFYIDYNLLLLRGLYFVFWVFKSTRMNHLTSTSQEIPDYCLISVCWGSVNDSGSFNLVLPSAFKFIDFWSPSCQSWFSSDSNIASISYCGPSISFPVFTYTNLARFSDYLL